MSKSGLRYLRLVVMVGGLLCVPGIWAAHVDPHALNSSKSKSTKKVSETQRTRRRMRHLARGRAATAHRPTVRRASATSLRVTNTRHRYHERFFMSSFAEGIAAGDMTDGEDPVVRQAAIDALGNMNGTVVAIEPTSGRVLAMVNQKL